jgi:hypothetical protein
MSGRLRRRRETVLGFGIYPIMMPASYLQAAFHEKNRVQDTRVVFQEGKKLLPRRAIAVVRDRLQSHNEAFDKEFFTLGGPRRENVRSVGQIHEGSNQRIE